MHNLSGVRKCSVMSGEERYKEEKYEWRDDYRWKSQL